MDEKDLQTSFTDYIEPSRIPFSYQSPGWYVLAVFVVTALLFLAFLIIRHYQRNRYRRKAYKFLSDLQQQYARTNSYNQLVFQTAILIKRIAMSKYGRTNVAGLYGSSWIQWFNKTTKNKKTPPFDETDLKLVTNDIYGNGSLTAEQVKPFLDKAKGWIKYHHAI
jgi:Domain of unknown function (DUF4381)